MFADSNVASFFHWVNDHLSWAAWLALVGGLWRFGSFIFSSGSEAQEVKARVLKAEKALYKMSGEGFPKLQAEMVRRNELADQQLQLLSEILTELKKDK